MGGREKKKTKNAQGGMHNSCVLCLKLEIQSTNIPTQFHSSTSFHMLLVLSPSSTLSTHSLLPQSVVGLFVGQDYSDEGNVSLGKGPVGALPLSDVAPAER